jgi:hypothetical protein
MADIVAKFKGTAPGPDEPGNFHQGLPARNLTADDWAGLDNEARQLVRSSPLYDYSGTAKVKSDKSDGSNG